MMRRAPSPAPSTTRESFVHRTQTVGQPVPQLADLQLQPVVPFHLVQCQVRGQAATTPAPLPGCPMPPMPSSTPSLGQCRARRHLPIQPFNHLETTLGTVACWTAQPSWLMTTTDTPPSTPATAWALLHP